MAAKRSKQTFPTVARIEGIVTSAGGAPGPRPSLILMVRPWRPIDGEVQRSELRIEVPLKSDRNLSRLMSTWDGKTVRVAVETKRAAGSNTLEWIVARSPLRRAGASSELLAERKRQSRPRRFRHDELGTLTLDRELGSLEARRKHAGRSYELLVDVPDPDDDAKIARTLERAASVVPRALGDLPRFRRAIADALLDLYNDNWREGPRPLTAAAFEKRHRLATLHIQHGRVTLYFDCGELFADHVVEVRLSPKLAVREVCLAG